MQLCVQSEVFALENFWSCKPATRNGLNPRISAMARKETWLLSNSNNTCISIAAFPKLNQIKDALQNTKLTKKTLQKKFRPTQYRTFEQSKKTKGFKSANESLNNFKVLTSIAIHANLKSKISPTKIKYVK